LKAIPEIDGAIGQNGSAALITYAVQAIAAASRSWVTPSARAALATTCLQRKDAAALPAPRPARKTARMSAKA
jgi:hypothetical protein